MVYLVCCEGHEVVVPPLVFDVLEFSRLKIFMCANFTTILHQKCAPKRLWNQCSNVCSEEREREKRERERERREEREREERERENEKLTEQWALMLSIPILSSLSWTPLLWRTQPTCACTFAPPNMKTIHLNVKFKALRFTLWNFLLAQYSPQGHLEPLYEVYMCVCVCVCMCMRD